MLRTKIRDRIFQLMKQNGIRSIYQMAQLSGLPTQTLYNLRRKDSNCPNVETISKICDGLGITLSQFYDFDDSMTYLNEAEMLIIETYRACDDTDKGRLIGYLDSLGRVSQK